MLMLINILLHHTYELKFNKINIIELNKNSKRVF